MNILTSILDFINTGGNFVYVIFAVLALMMGFVVYSVEKEDQKSQKK